MHEPSRSFDLNVDTILEAWSVPDALREIIANALDEQHLSGTPEVEIREQGGVWYVRDRGRGLRAEHLMQNESEEKLTADGVIGRFGVGLKDALATLDRHGIGVAISSSHGTFAPERTGKHGFEELVTLHVSVSDPPTGMVGTEFAFQGVTSDQIEEAKAYFLRFSGEQVLEETPYGQILARPEGGSALVYVSGVRVAEEPNMLFSYNVTSLTAAMKRALNRERTHVGRSAYTDRLKAMLLACTSHRVASRLVDDLEGLSRGDGHDEMNWLDVQVHACRLLNETADVVFVTPAELEHNPDAAYRAKGDGYRIVVTPDRLGTKLHDATDASGASLRTVRVFEQQFNDSFEFAWVPEAEMTSSERRVWQLRDRIVGAAGAAPSVLTIAVSETMRLDHGFEAIGLWQAAEGRIVVRRDQLASPEAFAGTLLHELAHARSGAGDMTRAFENELTDLMGRFAALWTEGSTRASALTPAKRKGLLGWFSR